MIISHNFRLESEYGVKVHRATIGRNLKRLSTDPVVRDAKRQFSESSQIYPELEGRLIDWWIIETSRGVSYLLDILGLSERY